MKTGVIYIATNQVTLKSYIGQTTDFKKRKQSHLEMRGDTHFARALRQHGADAFEWRLLETDIPVERLGNRETLWIAYYDSYHNGYNMTEGDEPSVASSPKVREVMSRNRQAKSARGENPMHDPDIRAKHKASMQAVVARGDSPMHNPESRAKLAVSAARTARRKVAEGIHHIQLETPEARAKRGRTVSKTLREQGAASRCSAEDSEQPCQIPHCKTKSQRTALPLFT